MIFAVLATRLRILIHEVADLRRTAITRSMNRDEYLRNQRSMPVRTFIAEWLNRGVFLEIGYIPGRPAFDFTRRYAERNCELEEELSSWPASDFPASSISMFDSLTTSCRMSISTPVLT